MAHGVRRCFALVFVAALCACTRSTTEVGAPSGEDDAAVAGRSEYLTRTPSEWLAVCASGAADVPSPESCESLRASSAAVRERAALAENVRANPGFEAQHFSHGYRRALSIAELLAGGVGAERDFVDANRAFPEHHDIGILLPWMSAPMCGASGSEVGSGPAAARCMSLDTACVRGRFDETSGCCTADVAPAGQLCGDGLLCDGAARCVSAESVPEGARVRPSYDWLALHPYGVGARGMTAELVGEVVRAANAPVGMPELSLEVRVPVDAPDVPEVFGDDGPPEVRPIVRPSVLAVVPGGVADQQRTTVLHSPPDAAFAALGIEGPRGVRALVFQRHELGASSAVFVVRGPIDELPAVLSDGSTAGAVRVVCAPVAPPTGDATSGAVGAVHCDLVGDLAVVVGDDVSVAWVEPTGRLAPRDLLGAGGLLERGDVRPRAARVARDGTGTTALTIGPGGIDIGYCGTRNCTATAGSARCSGIQICTNGNWGACLTSTAEVCNGRDDDCDFLVDENPTVLCNDGVGCTADSCGGTAGCVNTRQAFSRCVARSGCEIGVCTSPTGTSFSRTPGPRDTIVNPLPPGTPGCASTTGSCIDGDGDGDGDYDLPSGCSLRLGHQFCTDTWDSCVCNGPETCRPPTTPLEVGADSIGCATTPLRGLNAAGVSEVFDACDTNNNACNVERACCETGSTFCRTDAALTPAQITARQSACTATGSSFESWGNVPNAGVPALALCSPTIPTGPFPRCPNDLLPCTTESCNSATGACRQTFRAAGSPVATGETRRRPFLPDDVGPTCIGEAPGAPSCNDLSCNGFGGCDNDNLPDPSECTGVCPAAAGPMLCSRADLPAPSGLPNGCRPPSGRCLVAGTCPSGGSPSPANVCAVCDPDRNVWDYSPRFDAAPCDDGNPCTRDDRCDGASSGPPDAFCWGRAFASDGTACSDGYECSYGTDRCVAGSCRPTACSGELCGAPNCP